ncbi:MAG: ABC transporter substrate-binding protein [Pseudomonadota bacterium]
MNIAARFISVAWLAGVIASAGAADLSIGLKAELTSADPHILNGANRNILAHVYESLVAQDRSLRPVPGLALSWRMVDPTSWEFTLRPNVRFHNGAPLSAADVKYSIERAMAMPGPRTFRTYLKDVRSVSITGPSTVLVQSKRVSPTLPENVGLIAILPRALGTVAEGGFADGRAAVGTGPYRYGSWAHGQKLVLHKHAGYWGGAEPWDKVTLLFVPREPARAAALLSGSVDLVNDVTTHMEHAFRGYDIVSATSYMLNYLSLDQFRDDSPYVTGNNGERLAANPLKMLKVRRALNLAIDRQAIIRHVMKRDAIASGQMVPAGFFGHDDTIAPPAHDAAAARALLREAGYPAGFRLTIHCTNNRYLNDAKVCEAVAQMLTRVGIRTAVTTMPFAVFQTRAQTGGKGGVPEFSMLLFGVSAVTGNSITGLTSTIHSYDRALGTGVSNLGRYSNPQVDALIGRAASTIDAVAREDLQKQAAALALGDAAILPLLHLKAAWAMRPGLTYLPRSDGFTLAMNVRPKQ